MKIQLTVLLCLIAFNFILPQQKDTIFYKWLPTAAVGLNINQIALSNWTSGGDNAISWTLSGLMGLKYVTEDWIFKNNLHLAYGKTKLGGASFITNDNEFYLETILTRKIDWAVDPFISNTIRTPLTIGYNYKVTPFVPIANFFDPGYLTQSLGFIYNKVPGFTTRLGIAAQETFTKNYSALYNVDPESGLPKKFRLDAGLENVSTAEYKIADNLLYKGNLRLFTRFKSMDVWDVRWDNAVIAKINDYINVNFTYLFIYEKAQSPTAQMKESLQLGFDYSIL
ncbi:MAG: DUF3078 domain-containing protein [Ignavibacteriaceae bacterium]|nr:DUF3078 domain-containing protein [Ignavibacteriaceae bacterium]